MKEFKKGKLNIYLNTLCSHDYNIIYECSIALYTFVLNRFVQFRTQITLKSKNFIFYLFSEKLKGFSLHVAHHISIKTFKEQVLNDSIIKLKTTS